MMRLGSGTGAAPTRRAVAVYDSRSAVALRDESVLACCRIWVDGSWAKMLMRWHRAVLIFLQLRASSSMPCIATHSLERLLAAGGVFCMCRECL